MVLNRKGFTLIEIIAVIAIIGVLSMIGVMSVQKYIDYSRNKTYESYKMDLITASKNYFIDCMKANDEDCSIPSSDEVEVVVRYSKLLENGYTEKLKDPEGDGYCDNSYVVVRNTGDYGVNLEYYVCLFCSNYQSEYSFCE